MDDSDDWTDLVTPETLIRRITLDEYFAESDDWVRKGQIAQAAIAQDRAQLEARAARDDHWWERGLAPGPWVGGIALVRDGRVVWARDDWIK